MRSCVDTSVCCVHLEKGSCYVTPSGLILALVLPQVTSLLLILGSHLNFSHLQIIRTKMKPRRSSYPLAPAWSHSLHENQCFISAESVGSLSSASKRYHSQSWANPNRNIFLRLTTPSSNAIYLGCPEESAHGHAGHPARRHTSQIQLMRSCIQFLLLPQHC